MEIRLLRSGVTEGEARDPQQKEEQDERLPDLAQAKLELYRAKIEKTKAQTRLLNEMAACKEAEAELLSAQADLKGIEKKVQQSEWDNPLVAALLRTRRRAELVRDIRKLRDEAQKLKHRTNRPSHFRRPQPASPGREGGRVDQKQRVSEPQTKPKA